MDEFTEAFVIHGGSVVNRAGIVQSDVLVEDGRVARVGAKLVDRRAHGVSSSR